MLQQGRFASSIHALLQNVNLKVFVYDVEGSKQETQIEELEYLKKLGFKVNKEHQLCASIDDVEQYYQVWAKKKSKQEISYRTVWL